MKQLRLSDFSSHSPNIRLFFFRPDVFCQILSDYNFLAVIIIIFLLSVVWFRPFFIAMIPSEVCSISSVFTC